MECRYKYAHINIRYIFIFYFPKIFCPDFSVKIFIHNLASILLQIICINFGSQILILNSGRLQISRHISLVANNFLSTRQKFCFFHKANVL